MNKHRCRFTGGNILRDETGLRRRTDSSCMQAAPACVRQQSDEAAKMNTREH